MLRRTPSVTEVAAVVAASTETLPFRFPPFFIAVLAHLAGLVAVLSLVSFIGYFGGESVPLAFSSILEGAIAAYLSYRWGMRVWWIPIQLLFFPALLAMLAMELSSSWFMAAFLLTVSVYWSVFRTQVPLYLSSIQAWQAVAGLLPSKSGLRVIDLGSGLGGMLKYLSDIRGDAQFVGIEAAPLPFLVGWLRTRGGHCRMRFGSLWDTNLADFDFAYAYLSPVPMQQLWEKVKKEMSPGSLFVSNTFAVPDVVPSETFQLDDFHKSLLYIYRL